MKNETLSYSFYNCISVFSCDLSDKKITQPEFNRLLTYDSIQQK